MKKTKKQKSCIKTDEQIPIRVIYKKVGQAPEVKIINNVYILKKAIVKGKLDIIPYEKLFIICHNNKTSYNLQPNIYLPLRCILGSFIVVNIDRKTRDFKEVSQEDIIWYSKELIHKSPQKVNILTRKKRLNKITDIYEREFEDNRYYKSINFENTLISVLVDLERLLSKVLKSNGDDMK